MPEGVLLELVPSTKTSQHLFLTALLVIPGFIKQNQMLFALILDNITVNSSQGDVKEPRSGKASLAYTNSYSKLKSYPSFPKNIF